MLAKKPALPHSPESSLDTPEITSLRAVLKSQYGAALAMLRHLRLCDLFVGEAVDHMDLRAPECGFPWYRMSKQEHQLVSIRHIHHHAAQLVDRLRTRANVGIEWVGARSQR
jgi:hypothetical protein